VPFSSDPHAWLRPIYAELRRDPAFALLAPAHQFNTLCKAAEETSASKVALMREYNVTTQAALLDHLASRYRYQPAPQREVELWRVRKGDRELRCVAVYLPAGIDVRLIENDGFRRTVLVADARAVDALSQEWQAKLLRKDWR
jgi:hypothetical protein